MNASDFQSGIAEVIVGSTAHSGEFNMAVDGRLLDLANERDFSVVRIYEWEQPTVTLGHFQDAETGLLQSLRSVPSVRRLTGGGAILHDAELTYSCVLPATHPARHDPSELYRVVHRAIIALLVECGVSSSLRSERRDSADHGAPAKSLENWLCFLRSDPNDIVHRSGQKIVGSAQRRRRGIILQHGSIVLRASRLVPDVPGIADLTPEFDQSRFRRMLPETVAGSISECWLIRDYLPEERPNAVY